MPPAAMRPHRFFTCRLLLAMSGRNVQYVLNGGVTKSTRRNDFKRLKALSAIEEVQKKVANHDVLDMVPPRGWTMADFMKLTAIVPICGKSWTMMANLIPTRTVPAIKYQVTLAEERMKARSGIKSKGHLHLLEPEDFISKGAKQLRKGSSSSEDGARKIAAAALVTVDEKIAENGLDDFHPPPGWSKKQIIQLIALVPVVGRRWALIANLISVQTDIEVRAQYEQAEGRRLRRCEMHGLAYTPDILPTDFGPEESVQDKYADMRKAAYEALAEVNDKEEKGAFAGGSPNLRWSKIEILRLIAIAPICGNQWKVMSEVLETRGPQACRYQMEKAEDRRGIRCADPTSPKHLILEDFEK